MVMENRYDKYKDSGIAWIGEIPEHWDVKSIKSIFIESKEICSGKNITLLSLSQYTGIIPKSETEIALSHIAESYEGYKLVKKGQFVMNIMLAWNGSYAVSDYEGMISPAYCVFDFRRKCIEKFFHYLLRTTGYSEAFKTRSKGIIDSRLRLYPESFYKFDTIIPSLPEQQSIASYLDEKCSEIDELITLQEEMITKLQSYKRSVITEAVTKSLDKNVPLKDSGIEWIGEIPKHWDVRKLKNIFLLSTGTTPKDFDKLSEGDNLINWYTPSDILDSCNDLFSSQRKLSEKVIYNNKISLFPIGTLLYVGIGASAGKVGYANEIGYSNQQITGLLPLECYSRFYFYYLSALKDKIRDNAFFTTLPIINNAYLGQEIIPYPPLPEQQTISDYLDKKCSEIDELITIKQQKIEKLKDYKKSLIFECVTGKRKVS